MDLQLNGKTALVSGSTGGIGLAIAQALGREGAKVTIVGRGQTGVDKAVAATENASGIVADLATADGAEAVIKALPHVDILVNNLGIYEAKPFEEISDADWLRLFEVNVLSGIRLSRHYFPGMLARDWGRVIFIASESALSIPEEMVHYGMTKTAQLAVARGLAERTKGSGVTVNSVLPGPTQSEGIFEFLRSIASDPKASDAEVEAEFFRLHRSSSLLQRLIKADEIASLVAYLSSPLAAATNGAAIRAEGGLVKSI
ncbi:MAG: oxidoreductase [Sphingomonas sanxanigenens]|uniref:Oxidoreductase n=1 Tax=Sphingomonas sanxanigenens TaxID=397260 RepID=A0A2W5AC03_9SPHN|nr:MAG: oxidoreductase [Sphingomonas sanxanigenens]